MKDWRGTVIEVGSHVVYPGRHSSSMWVTEGEVVGLKPKTELRWNFDAQARVPTEIGHVTVIRKRATGWQQIVEDPQKPKTYDIMVDHVTVVDHITVVDHATEFTEHTVFTKQHG